MQTHTSSPPPHAVQDLFAMLGAMDEREAAVVREITSLLDDQADIGAWGHGHGYQPHMASTC